ncbi:carbohydrate ABC transporter permease [Ruania rhizosphaerae]|uniref:carbohydrate ABC transporter permease n=1 Tax=Ruania rhizosphaerae TaxID=1840413 RepID=UPI00135B04EE|nr:sugar ABC transporter permease [Ruania rhizosphaerae]
MSRSTQLSPPETNGDTDDEPTAAPTHARPPSGPLAFWKAHDLPILFILPTVLLIGGFMIFPLGYSIVMSFFDWNGLTEATFTGLDNYARLIADSGFWGAVQNNGLFLLLFTFFTVSLGFIFAVAISRRMKGWRIYRFTFFIPFILVTAVIAVLWAQIYEPTHGILNSALGAIGLESWQQLWLGNPTLTMYSISVIAIWQLSGWTMLLYLGAMEAIDEEIHDAATIDGVSSWQRCWYIIAPLVRRMTIVLVMLQIIAAIKTFDLIWVLTKGGPFYASEVMGTLLYRTAFEQQDFGYASTVAVAMTVIVMVSTLIYLKFTKLTDQE